MKNEFIDYYFTEEGEKCSRGVVRVSRAMRVINQKVMEVEINPKSDKIDWGKHERRDRTLP